MPGVDPAGLARVPAPCIAIQHLRAGQAGLFRCRCKCRLHAMEAINCKKLFCCPSIVQELSLMVRCPAAVAAGSGHIIMWDAPLPASCFPWWRRPHATRFTTRERSTSKLVAREDARPSLPAQAAQGLASGAGTRSGRASTATLRGAKRGAHLLRVCSRRLPPNGGGASRKAA